MVVTTSGQNVTESREECDNRNRHYYCVKGECILNVTFPKCKRLMSSMFLSVSMPVTFWVRHIHYFRERGKLDDDDSGYETVRSS